MDIVEWLRQFKLSTSDSNYNALIVNGKTEEAADEIERLRIDLEVAEDRKTKAQLFQNDMLKEIERLREDKAELVEALQNIADGPRDVEKSYISLLHEVQSEARDAIAKATGGE